MIGATAVSGICLAGPVTYRVVDLGVGDAWAIDNGIAAGEKQVTVDSELQTHAGFWTAGGASFVDLTPPNAPPALREGRVLGIRGNAMVGELSPGDVVTPVRWSGPTHTVQVISDESGSLHGVDANGAGAVGTFTRPKGVNPSSETPTHPHAVFINSSGTTVDLNPAGHTESSANGIAGNEVGSSDSHAAFWRNTPDSFVDLNPTGFDASVAEFIAGGQIAGRGSPAGSGQEHALLWMDTTAESAIDLNPVGFTSSAASGLNTTEQWIVGRGIGAAGTPEHALLWTGNASDPVLGGTVVDLSAFLPGSLRGGSSQARAIDEHGDIVGVANGHAVLWIPTTASAIPLPAAAVPGVLMLATISGALTLRRRRAKQLA